MLQLTPPEARVLGVLIEKAQTTPAQYPMSLNSITVGCNQKSNREPVVNYSDEIVFDALDSLRQKGFVRQVDLSGSRVEKFRHVARDTLDVTTHQLVVLAELMMRGPQTVGEIRGRATRMHPIETLEQAQNILDSLIAREPPLVRRVPPAPGSRAELYEQLLAPGLHSIDTRRHDAEPAGVATAPRSSAIEERLAALEAKVEQLMREMKTEVH